MDKKCSETKGSLMTLSPREHDVLTLMACGFTDKEIAVRLKISIKTTATYASNILFKLNAKTRTHAAIRYYKKNPKWKIGERYIVT